MVSSGTYNSWLNKPSGRDIEFSVIQRSPCRTCASTKPIIWTLFFGNKCEYNELEVSPTRSTNKKSPLLRRVPRLLPYAISCRATQVQGFCPLGIMVRSDLEMLLTPHGRPRDCLFLFPRFCPVGPRKRTRAPLHLSCGQYSSVSLLRVLVGMQQKKFFCEQLDSEDSRFQLHSCCNAV